MKEFTKEQPMDGDNVLSCGHLDAKIQHWWKFSHESYFRRPDGTVGTASWLVACEDCRNACGGDPTKIEVRTDAVWKGNEPAITEN